METTLHVHVPETCLSFLRLVLDTRRHNGDTLTCSCSGDLPKFLRLVLDAWGEDVLFASNEKIGMGNVAPGHEKKQEEIFLLYALDCWLLPKIKICIRIHFRFSILSQLVEGPLSHYLLKETGHIWSGLSFSTARKDGFSSDPFMGTTIGSPSTMISKSGKFWIVDASTPPESHLQLFPSCYTSSFGSLLQKTLVPSISPFSPSAHFSVAPCYRLANFDTPCSLSPLLSLLIHIFLSFIKDWLTGLRQLHTKNDQGVSSIGHTENPTISISLRAVMSLPVVEPALWITGPARKCTMKHGSA